MTEEAEQHHLILYVFSYDLKRVMLVWSQNGHHRVPPSVGVPPTPPRFRELASDEILGITRMTIPPSWWHFAPSEMFDDPETDHRMYCWLPEATIRSSEYVVMAPVAMLGFPSEVEDVELAMSYAAEEQLKQLAEEGHYSP